MAYFLKVRGIPVRCETIEELNRVIAEHGTPAPENSGRETRSTNGATHERHIRIRPTESTRKLLTILYAVKAVGRDGIAGNDLGAKVAMDDARGLGGLMASAAGTLNGGGLKFSEVLVGKRGRDRKRRWYAGRRIDEAIEALES